MANLETVIRFRVSDELAALVEKQAEAEGVSVSSLLRRLAEDSASDARDVALLAALEAGEPGAVDELLALNMATLVHGIALGDDAAAPLVIHLARHLPPERLSGLVALLVAALDRSAAAVPDHDDIVALAALYSRRMASKGGEPA